MTRRLRFALFAAMLLAAGATQSALAQSSPSPAAPLNPRIALVIGEATYADQALATPVNDAALLAQTLQAAGFDVVGARDLDEKSVQEAMRDFLAKAAAVGPAMQAVVYLAGRAVQYEGENFFVPVDAQIARDSDVPIEAVRLSDFTHALAAEPGQARIVVLDAARTNPYARQGQPLAGGLALVAPDDGVLIAFNAAPGAIAGDEPGPYGVYAKTLAGTMREGGLPIADVFAQTRVAVNQATAGAQVPWSASKLSAPYFVFERADDAPPPPALAALSAAEAKPIQDFPADQAYAAALARDTLAGYVQFLAADPDSPQAARVRAILAARREALFWRQAVAQDMAQAYWTYLERYPRGPHVADAERRLAILSASANPPSDFAPLDYADLPPPPQDETVYANQPVYVFVGPNFGPPPPPPPPYFVASEDETWRRLPPPGPPLAVGVLPALSVAIPLIVGARAYSDAGRRTGFAPPGAPAPLALGTPAAPPPLPGGAKPLGSPPMKTPLVSPTPSPSPPLPKSPAGELKPIPRPTPPKEPSVTPLVGETPLKTLRPELRTEPKPEPTLTAKPEPRLEPNLEPKFPASSPGKRQPACGKPGEPRCPK